MERRLATAEWVSAEDFVALEGEYETGKFWLGRSPQDGTPLGYIDDRHICLVSGTRAGKGTTSILTNLCLWPGSLVAIDPKGENATVAAARRGKGSDYCEGMGQSVHVLDPFGVATIDDAYRSRFNPLDALDPNDPCAIDEAGRVASALVVINKDAKDPFWDESARKLVKGLILHVLTCPLFEGRRTLGTVRKLITRGDFEGVQILREAGEEKIPSGQALLWEGVAQNEAFDGVVSGIGESMVGLVANNPKMFESILQVADRNTEFLDSPGIQECLASSNFRLSDLKTNPKGVSVFLSLPQRYMEEHYRWLRLMITLIVTEMEAVPGKPATGHRVLLCLDEFAGLRRMEVIENAFAQLAGFGVTLFFAVQTLSQLHAIYDKSWEALLSNCGTKIFFGIDEHFTREYVSKLIGETEVIREIQNSSETEGSSESQTTGSSRSSSHSESRSRSDGQTESATRGTSEGVSVGESASESVGTSHSEGRGETSSTGWNRSSTRGSNEGRSESHNQGRSKGKSDTWQNTYPFGHNSRSTNSGTNEGRTDSKNSGSSKSRTSGKSGTKGTSLNENFGTSTNTSKSKSQTQTRSASESETVGHSSTQTEGESRGKTESESTSQQEGRSTSQTRGRGQAIHKRPLVSPDELGSLFDRSADGGAPLALVLVGGRRPLVARRTAYFEDPEFRWLYDAHPDHEPPPRLMALEDVCLPAHAEFLDVIDVKWKCREGDEIACGEVFADVVVSGPNGRFDAECLREFAPLPPHPTVSAEGAQAIIPMRATVTGALAERPTESPRDTLDLAMRPLARLRYNRRQRALANWEAPESDLLSYLDWLEVMRIREEEGRTRIAARLEQQRKEAQVRRQLEKRREEERRLRDMRERAASIFRFVLTQREEKAAEERRLAEEAKERKRIADERAAAEYRAARRLVLASIAPPRVTEWGRGLAVVTCVVGAVVMGITALNGDDWHAQLPIWMAVAMLEFSIGSVAAHFQNAAGADYAWNKLSRQERESLLDWELERVIEDDRGGDSRSVAELRSETRGAVYAAMAASAPVPIEVQDSGGRLGATLGVFSSLFVSATWGSFIGPFLDAVVAMTGGLFVDIAFGRFRRIRRFERAKNQAWTSLTPFKRATRVKERLEPKTG